MSVNSIIAVGVGGGGINTIEQMIACKPAGVKFVAVSNDVRLLAETSGIKLLLGDDKKSCRGSSCNSSIARQSAEKIETIIANALKGAEMVFVSVALGGGTGSGAAPVIARIAHDMGILVIGLVSMPFTFEGERTAERARQGFVELKKYVDVLFEYKKDRLLESHLNLPMLDAYELVCQYFSFIIHRFTALFSSSNKGILLGLKRVSSKAKPIEFPPEATTEELILVYAEAVSRFAALKNTPKVAIFWYHNKKVLGDFFDFTSAEISGNVVGPKSNHYDFWEKIQAANPDLACEEYEYTPTGKSALRTYQ